MRKRIEIVIGFSHGVAIEIREGGKSGETNVLEGDDAANPKTALRG
jgi:hypothetical protein